MRSRGAVWSGVLPFALAATLDAATFTVTNTDDSGAGSLRQAIDGANTNPGADTIAFDIPGAGVHAITPATPLPLITDPVLIDGYTQAGASVNTDPLATNAVLLIELDGTAASGTGLHITGGGSTVRGLVLNRWVTALRTTGTGGNIIRGNFFGTDAAGAVRLENSSNIGIADTGENLIGGTAPADRNLISGSLQCCSNSAIHVQSSDTLIQGNLIGTDATGTVAIPNEIGVTAATVGGSGIRIGGSEPGAGNVISGNRTRGIWLTQSPSNAVVQGNRIGTTADGTGPLGNGEGIVYELGGSNTTIGGVGPGEGNVIAFNLSRGIIVAEGSANTIRGNSIHDNGNIGIDLSNDFFPNFNDALDADAGPNGRQNFPIVRQIEHLGPAGKGTTRIVAKFHSTPSTTFDLDFYSNPACPRFPREFLEGETWLGTSPVTTDASGDAAIDVTLPVQTEAGARISITATDPNGNTSEFSQRIIFSIDPTSGPDTGGSAFGVLGTDFTDPTALTIGGVPATGVAFTDDHMLSGVMPALAPGTSHDVVAQTPDGTTGTLIKGWVSDFLDVQPGHLFHDFVVTLVSNGITVGVGNGLYGVDQGTKRQQMAVFLLKARNGLCYVPPPCTGSFPDVPCPSTFADWIEELADQGITTGCGGGLFCPDNLVTRRQMAVFLLKTKYGSVYVPPACAGIFDDVACPGAPAVDFIEQLFNEQITGGCSVTPALYCPDGTSTRGQMAVFITKTFGLQ